MQEWVGSHILILICYISDVLYPRKKTTFRHVLLTITGSICCAWVEVLHPWRLSIMLCVMVLKHISTTMAQHCKYAKKQTSSNLHWHWMGDPRKRSILHCSTQMDVQLKGITAPVRPQRTALQGDTSTRSKKPRMASLDKCVASSLLQRHQVHRQAFSQRMPFKMCKVLPRLFRC